MSQFATLILLLLAIAFFLQIDFIFYIIYVCVGVYAWSLWHTPRALKKISIQRRFNDHAFWGETVPVTIRLINRNWLALPWVQLSENIAVQLAMGQTVNRVLSLPGNGVTEIPYAVRARRRGYYRLGPLRLTLGDLFGLAREQQRILPADYLTIYPRITPLAQLGLPSRLPFGTIPSRQRLFEDPSRPFGVRDFYSGDSLRQINWKVSAHTRNLVVKTLEPAISLETALLLNLYNDDYRRQERDYFVEWAIEVAASLAAHLSDQRQAVGLIANGVDPLAGERADGPDFDELSGRLYAGRTRAAAMPPVIPPRTGRSHLMKILEQLARIESGSTLPFGRWATGACLGLSWGTTIFAITASGDEQICQSLHHLVRSGYNPMLIAIEPDYNFGQVRERARCLGFKAFNVTDKRGLERWRRRQRAGAV